jgi:outer membrane lipopolysaccharide assembly protein LptE/RlpB
MCSGQWPLPVPCALCLVVLLTGCGIYKFADVSIDPNIKTVKVNYIENRASYINPQLSPQLTDKLRQKIVNQTKLTQVSNDNPHLEISGEVRQYLVTTSAISNQQVASNRLSITVHIIVLNRLKDEPPKEYDVSRSFDFAANLTLAQAEARLNEEIIRNLVDETFNRIFSEW